MANPDKENTQLADESQNGLISSQQALVADLTDSTSGTADGTLEAIGNTTTADQSGAIENNLVELNTSINSILDILESHGLMADS